MKKQVLFPIVLVGIMLAGTGFSIFYYQRSRTSSENGNTAGTNTTCIKEGAKNYGEAPVVYQCCPGLRDIAAIDDQGVQTFDVSYCTNCGNGKCQKPENKYNCPADCT